MEFALVDVQIKYAQDRAPLDDSDSLGLTPPHALAHAPLVGMAKEHHFLQDVQVYVLEASTALFLAKPPVHHVQIYTISPYQSNWAVEHAQWESIVFWQPQIALQHKIWIQKKQYEQNFHVM
jgi:hypothetical protein